MPNVFASLAVMYVSLSSAAFTSPSPLPLCAPYDLGRGSRRVFRLFRLDDDIRRLPADDVVRLVNHYPGGLAARTCVLSRPRTARRPWDSAWPRHTVYTGGLKVSFGEDILAVVNNWQNEAGVGDVRVVTHLTCCMTSYMANPLVTFSRSLSLSLAPLSRSPPPRPPSSNRSCRSPGADATDGGRERPDGCDRATSHRAKHDARLSTMLNTEDVGTIHAARAYRALHRAVT